MADKKNTKKKVNAPVKAAKAATGSAVKKSPAASQKANSSAGKAPVKSEARKPAAKKPVAAAKSAGPSKEDRKPQTEIKRVPPRIIRKPAPSAKVQTDTYREIDTKAAVAFASSIAQEMKRSAAEADQNRLRGEIQLSRRPTTRTQGCNTEKFPESALKEFRKRLIDAREAALKGVDAMKATGFNESEDHEADGGDGTNQTLRLQALGHMGNIHRTIQQIEEALHRIEDGTYGVCTSCGQLIRKPRLMNQPFVLTCMECQSEMERNRQ